MIGKASGKVSLYVGLLLAQLIVVVKPEILDLGLNMIIDASSDEVHFVKGYLKAPASIDLSNVRWITNDDLIFETDDFYENGPEDITDDFDEYNPEEIFDDFDNESDPMKNEDVDNGNTPEPPEPESGGDDEEEPTRPAEDTAEAPTEVENEEEDSAVEPTNESENNNDEVDVASGTKEDTTDTVENVEDEPLPVTPTEDGDDEGNDEASELEDAEVNIEVENPTPAPSDEGGHRSLAFTTERSTAVDQIMEILVFSVPHNCKKDATGSCDWVALGVGAYDDEMIGSMSYCCSEDAAYRNICNADEIGTMMVDHAIFDGEHRKIHVPSTPLTDIEMDDPVFQIQKSGDHVMIIANCDDDGFGIIALGDMKWKSVGGYLPGDVFDFMLFICASASIYLALAIWYMRGMSAYQDAAIPIQKYILATIILGFVCHVLKSIDFLFWNTKGVRSEILMYIAIAFATLFQASLRCLGVMVAMGWGVVRDSLGMTLCKIILLGSLYAGLAILRDSFEAIAMSSKGLVSSNESEELFDLALVLVPLIALINFIFYVWIIRSLNVTTEYLKNMNQTSKLRRHLRLRCLIITSLVVITVLTGVNAVQRMAIVNSVVNPDAPLQPFLTTDQVWILRGVGAANYLLILLGVAFLWRPHSDAKDYAMQMQLPTSGDDENDLELSCVVPSADDIDTGEGYNIEHAIPS